MIYMQTGSRKLFKTYWKQVENAGKQSCLLFVAMFSTLTEKHRIIWAISSCDL